MPAIDNFLATWSPRALSILRIIVGLLFLEHGTSKYLSLPVSPSTGVAPISLSGINGMIELVGGVLIVLGLFTRGRVHPGRRHGRRILHSARPEGLLSAPERG
jgi:hypothetical protein